MTLLDSFFVYNGIPSTTLGIFLPRGSLHVPMLPKTRERLVEIPTRNGAWNYGSFYGPLEFSIDIVMLEASRNDLLARVDALAALLDVRLGERPFMLSDRPAKYWNAQIAGVVDYAPLASGAELKLPFIATSPFAVAV